MRLLTMASVHRLWSCCFSPDCCVPFLVGCPFRVVLRLNSFFSVLIAVTSGVSVDLSSTESVFEVLVFARVLLARFTLVFFFVF